MDTPAPAAPTPPAADPVAPPTPTERLDSLTPSQLLDWRTTGNLPDLPAPDDDEDGDDEPIAAAPVAAPTTAAPVVPTPPVLSKRQQKINEQITAAVEKATADLRAENARLKQAPRDEPRRDTPPPVARPAAAVAPTEDPEPDASDLTKYPAGEFDPKYARDIAAWSAREQYRQHDAQAQARAEREAHSERVHQGARDFAAAFEAKKAADPTFAVDVTVMEQLIPLSVLPTNEQGQPVDAQGQPLLIGPANIIAEALFRHPATAPDVIAYLSANSNAEWVRLTARDPRSGQPAFASSDLIREVGRIEGALKRGADPVPPPNTITNAPAPPTTLGDRSTTTDPIDAALKSGDAGAYIAAANARELAARK